MNGYDRLAWFYDRYWGDRYPGGAGGWAREDVLVEQRCCAPGEVLAALARAGLAEAREHDAARDLGVTGELGVGRSFFTARRPPGGGS